MNSQKELSILKDVLKKSENDKLSFISQGWFTPLFWIVGALSSMYLYKGFQSGDVSLIFLFLGAVLVGMAVSFVSIQQNGERAWGFVKKHIDKESVETRINELNT